MQVLLPHRRQFLLSAAAGGAVLCQSRLFGKDDDPMAGAADSMITSEAQRAIEGGLEYLFKNQLNDGSWGGDRQYKGNVAVTSLCGLAFMAGGHQPGRGNYGKAVEKAIDFVLSKEAKDPDRTPGFLHNPSGSPFGPMYSHGFATLFLAEAYGMIPKKESQKRLREALERAVKLIVDTQNNEGGWRYEPKKSQADISVTICQIMALRAARNVGVHVPKDTVINCTKYVVHCQNHDGGFNYFRTQKNQSAFARSAAGVVALYCAGVYNREDVEKNKDLKEFMKGDEMERGLRYLRQFKPNGNAFGPWGRGGMDSMHYYYGQYYAAQAMWTAGESWWKDWFPAIREELLALARRNGKGEWADQTTCTDYATAMALIILQIPNNYLPIMQK
jgi:hypothetical protein